MSDVLYPYALDESGGLISAATAPRRKEYRCPVCAAPLIACGGEQRRCRSHFRHKVALVDSLAAQAHAETYLHGVLKRAVKDGIEAARRAGRPYEVHYTCSACGEKLCLDLAAVGGPFELEKTLASHGLRPDISLVDSTGGLQLAIEIVVSHFPDPESLSAYWQIGAPLVLCNPRDRLERLNDLRSGLPAEVVEAVLYHPCPACRAFPLGDWSAYNPCPPWGQAYADLAAIVCQILKSTLGKGRAVALQPDVFLPGVGHVDCLVVTPSGQRMAHRLQMTKITAGNLEVQTQAALRHGVELFWWLGPLADTPANRGWCCRRYGYSLGVSYAASGLLLRGYSEASPLVERLHIQRAEPCDEDETDEEGMILSSGILQRAMQGWLKSATLPNAAIQRSVE